MSEEYGPFCWEYLVFCCDEATGAEKRYGSCLHEADVLLLALRRCAARGEITTEEARCAWAQYRDVDPGLLELPEYQDDGDYGFPPMDGTLSLGTDEFIEEAASSGIPNVRLVDGIRGQLLEVRGTAALEALKERLAGRYRIVEKSSLRDYGSPKDWQEAAFMIDRTQRRIRE